MLARQPRLDAAVLASSLLALGFLTVFGAVKRGSLGEAAFVVALLGVGPLVLAVLYVRSRARAAEPGATIALAAGLLLLTMVVGGVTGSTFAADTALGLAATASGIWIARRATVICGLAITVSTLSLYALGAPENLVPIVTGGLLMAGGALLRAEARAAQ